MTEQEKEKIIQKLREKNVNLGCPRCNNKNFTLVNGYFKQIIQNDLKNTALGGPSIPFVMTVCVNCGFISQHALGAIDMLPKKQPKIKIKQENGK